MRLLLLTTALTGLTLAPALAQDDASERRGVSPQEYFGDRDADGTDEAAEAQQPATGDGTVTVTITGVEPDGGEIYVALQDEAGFAQKGGAYTQTVTPDRRSVRVTFDGVAAGAYAVAAFQDTNGDGDVSIGDAGPSEPWGVSGGTPRRGAPTFADAMIDVDGETRARLRLIGGERAAPQQTERRAQARRRDAEAAATSAADTATDAAQDTADTAMTAADRVRRADARQSNPQVLPGTNTRRAAPAAAPLPPASADDTAENEASGDATLTVTITGVEPDGGAIYVALQEQNGFAQEDGAYTQTASADGRTATVTFDGVEPGDYAVAAFQDTDGDGGLTLRAAGPTEPWGFSGRVSRSAAPRFDDASISVDGRTRTRLRLSGGETASDPRAAAPGDRATAPMTDDEDGERMSGTAEDDVADAADTMTDDGEARGGAMTPSTPAADMASDAEPTDDVSDMNFDASAPAAPAPARAATAPGADAPASGALIYRRSAALAPSALTARDYLGAELTNAQGEEIAGVEDVILDAGGQAVGVVLATGGLFGIGEDYYAVTFDRVRPAVEDGDLRLVSTLSEDDVERLREFDLDAFKANIGDRRLASDLAGAEVAVGDRTRGRVDDVVMSAEGAVEAVVLDMDGDQFIVAYDDLSPSDDGFTLTGGDASTLTRFEGRQGPRRTVRERVLGERR